MRILFLGLLALLFASPAEAVRLGVPSGLLMRRVGTSVARTLMRLRFVRIPAAAANQSRLAVPASDMALRQSAELLRQQYVLPSLALPLDPEGRVLGSGFVMRAPSGALYAVTAYHVVGSAGKETGVRLFRPDGKTVEYNNLTVSSGGSYGVNAPDVSLIELPEEAGGFVRPLEVAPYPPAPGSRLFMWGRPYDAPDFALAKELEVDFAYGMKISLRRTEHIPFLEGMCGSPVFDEKGFVTGIYGGRAGKDDRLFAIDARKSLSWLLQNRESGTSVPYTFKVFGTTALELGQGESLMSVYHQTPDGATLEELNFPAYQGRLDVLRLEEAFSDLRSGDIIVFEVFRGRIFSRMELFTVP